MIVVGDSSKVRIRYWHNDHNFVLFLIKAVNQLLYFNREYYKQLKLSLNKIFLESQKKIKKLRKKCYAGNGGRSNFDFGGALDSSVFFALF